MTDLVALVLAAGASRRMQSPLSKVLHPIAGRPLLHYAVSAARSAGAARVIVIASARDREAIAGYLVNTFGAEAVSVAVQDPPRGTGDAVRVGLAAAPESADRVLIVCGDVPLVSAVDLRALVEHETGRSGLCLGTCRLRDPSGYGRILRDGTGRAVAIREQRDLSSDAERGTNEINAGVYAARRAPLEEALREIVPNNAQGEYYLTDVVPWFAQRAALATRELAPEAAAGVNDRAQLAWAEEQMFARIAERHRLAGSSLARGVCIDDTVTLGKDVHIRPNVHLRGATTIGDGSRIDVGSVVENSSIGAGVSLLPYTIVSDSEISAGCQLGPFTHVRPGSVLEPDVKLGNFVEAKATRMRRGAKANHLSYLGDGDVGENTNIGAGTIFCNYDGVAKHRTSIGRDVFVGSDSQLIAPISIGDGAYVATATTVSEDVPADALAIGRVRQANKEGYASKLRARQRAAKAARATGAKLTGGKSGQ